jgi:hypothetical protein
LGCHQEPEFSFFVWKQSESLKIYINCFSTLYDNLLHSKWTQIRYVLIRKFGSQLKSEHNSRKNFEKSLLIFKVFVFRVQFFASIFPWISCLIPFEERQYSAKFAAILPCVCRLYGKTIATNAHRWQIFGTYFFFENEGVGNAVSLFRINSWFWIK